MNTEVINEFLIVQGKVPEDLLKKLNFEVSSSTNEGWFYLDYSPVDYKFTSNFDIILAGPDTSLFPQICEIKIIKAADQFGFFLESIPKGYKSIALLSFLPDIPEPISALPYLRGWNSNSKQVFLAQHNQIKYESKVDYISSLIKIIAFQIHSDVNANNSFAKNTFTKPELINKFHNSFNLETEIAIQLLNDLVKLGYMKEKFDNQETKLTFAD